MRDRRVSPTELDSATLSHRERAGSVADAPQLSPQSDATALGDAPTELVKRFAELSFLPFDSKVQVPTIVITGDQSAGKSSLIEAITTITVPRDAGTCTRCPIHVSMTEAKEWSCKVFIEKMYDFTGRRSGALGPWVLKPEPTSIFFANLQDPEEVEDVLRRAQLAVLNPSSDPLSFLAFNVNHGRNQEFSPNVVRLDIRGPQHPNLSFYDLPGVISTAKAGQSYLPTMVRTLIRGYLQRENNIILLALPMHNDIENCAALGLVREAKAESRCLGVLTKPDRMQSGDPVDAWEAVLDGRDHQLGHGYYITKQPSQEEKARMSHTDAREAEVLFFDKEAPWCAEFVKFRSRCTTSRLQTKLSELLIAAIKSCVPTIKAQVSDKLHQVNTQLHLLPSSPGDNALTLVVGVLAKLNRTIEESLNSDRPKNQFMLLWRGLFKQLAEAFSQKRPMLLLPTTAPTDTQTITISDDEDMDDGMPSTPRKRSKQTKSESPTKKPRISYAEHGNQGMKVRLEEIRSELQAFTGNKLQNKADTGVASIIICNARVPWRELVLNFVDESSTLLRKHVLESLDISLGHWKNTALHDETVEHITDFVNGRSAYLIDNVTHLLNSELQEPFTFDDETLQRYIGEESAHFMDRCRAKLIENQSNGGRESGAKGKSNMKAIEVPEDPYKYEIEVMATARGYYRLASASLLDHVAKAVTFDLFEHTKKDLETYLHEALKVNENDALANCKRLLEQDPEIAKRREDLLREKANYERANEILNGIRVFGA